MARNHGRLFASMWDDDDYIATSIEAKAVFGFLVSQPDLAHSGVIGIRIPPWARRLNTTPARLEALLDEMHDGGFIVVDRDEMQVLVRSLIRRDGVYKQPNVFKAAVDHIYTVSSRPIRRALLSELQRLDESEMNGDSRKINANVIGWLQKGSGNPSPNPSRKGPGNPDRPDLGSTDVRDESDIQTASDTSEIRQSTSSAEPVAKVYELAGHPADVKGSENPSAIPFTHTPARAGVPRSPTTVPYQEPEPFLSATATPPADEPAASKPKRSQKKAPAEPRPDVEALCNRLVDLMVENGSDKPSVTDAWRTQARLLLDKDHQEFGHREFDKTLRVLEWALKHHFWWKNIRSIPKFREQYGRLRDEALAEWKRDHPGSPSVVPGQRSDSNVLPFQRAASNDVHLAAAMERAQARDAAQAANPERRTSPWKAITA